MFGLIIGLLLVPLLLKKPLKTTSLSEFQKLILENKKVCAIGNTSHIPSGHPVLQLVLNRWRENSIPGSRKDQYKLALAIEGGGMRGCVAAGATAALEFLGLSSCIDSVYGSSAGSMVGAYFVSRQSGGIRIYHSILPMAKDMFIDKKKLINAAGIVLPSAVRHKIFGLKMPRDRSFRKYALRSDVFNLNYLLDHVMLTMQSLDWQTFQENSAKQPLYIVSSGLKSLQSVVLSQANGNFACIQSLLGCIRASMTVPGVTGNNIVSIKASGPNKAPDTSYSSIPREIRVGRYAYTPIKNSITVLSQTQSLSQIYL